MCTSIQTWSRAERYQWTNRQVCRTDFHLTNFKLHNDTMRFYGMVEHQTRKISDKPYVLFFYKLSSWNHAKLTLMNQRHETSRLHYQIHTANWCFLSHTDKHTHTYKYTYARTHLSFQNISVGPCNPIFCMGFDVKRYLRKHYF